MSGYETDSFWPKIQLYLPENNRLTESTVPEEMFLSVCGMDIHVDCYTPQYPKGRVILFHGIGGNGRLLSFLAVPLMRSGFEVLCPDMPLYGYTRFSQHITYDTWVSCGTEIVRHFQGTNNLSTFLFGLSAGGMLAYQIVSECTNIAGLVFTCILDQRNKEVTKRSASNYFLSMIAKPLIALAQIFAGSIKIPMKWVGNMKAIVNNKELAVLLMKDTKSAGVNIPIRFIHTLLNPSIKIEPENFTHCPVLLVHPGNDLWINITLSNFFYDRLACEKQAVILEGAGHFPIEALGLKQMETACIAFFERCVSLQNTRQVAASNKN